MFNPDRVVHECSLCEKTFCYDFGEGKAMVANTGVGEAPIDLDKIKIVSFPVEECPIRMMLLGGRVDAETSEE